MKCPDEPTLMLLADEELDASAALHVREHVTRCASCAARLADLREERKALVAALGESGLDELAAVPALAASAAPAQGSSGSRWWELALAAAVLAVAGVAAWATGVTALWQVPPFMGWADPFNPLGRLTWLFTGITLGVSAAFAGAALASTVTTIGQIMATVLLMLVLLTVARASRRVVITGLLAVLLTAPATRSEAIVVWEDDGDFVVAAGETLDDTLVAGAERVIIEGTVTGDVIAGGGRVVMRGVVHGNLIAWAQYTDVTGDVGGSLFVSGQDVTVQGSVGGGVYAFGQYLRVLEGGRVAGSITSSTQMLTVDGVVERDVLAGAYRVEIGGVVRRNVTAQAGRISVGPRGRVDGTLTARVGAPEDLQIDPGASLAAEPEVRLWRGDSSSSRYLTGSFYLWQAVWLFAAFVTGWLLARLAPGATAVRFEDPAATLRTLGVGFLCVVATPVAAIIAGVTLVGLPLALVALGVWALGIYLAKIPVAFFLGRTILGPHDPGGPAPALLVGLLAVFIAVNLPFVGWIVNLALTLVGVGVLFAWAMSAYRRGTEPAGT